MSQTYDYILEHGTLVNHDGEGQRDVGVSGGRIAAIGPQKSARVTYLRDGREASADVTLAALPEQTAQARALSGDRQGDDRDDRAGGGRL